VLLKFGKLPVKASVDILHGVPVDSFLLKQYGFKNDPFNVKFWQKDDLIVYLVGRGEYRVAFKTKIYDKVYKYFHQLQNIYHAHTADELSFCFGE
jgi:hypothetical protein